METASFRYIRFTSGPSRPDCPFSVHVRPRLPIFPGVAASTCSVQDEISEGAGWGRGWVPALSVAAHNSCGGATGECSGESAPAESGESAIKPDPKSTGWIKKAQLFFCFCTNCDTGTERKCFGGSLYVRIQDHVGVIAVEDIRFTPDGIKAYNGSSFRPWADQNSERSRLAQSFDYNYGDFIPIPRPFLRGYLNKCRDLQTRRLAFFNTNYVEKRRKVMDTPGEDKNKLRCAIDHILAAEKSGEITPENVIYIVENINVTAIETTLWSIEWALAEVVNHPDVQRKVGGEIRDVLSDDEPITESSVNKLAYLQAMIKETLWLHSPIPILVPHMNFEEAILGGYTIPKGSKVVFNAWWLANNPELWEKPEEFRLERFLGEESNMDATVGGKVDFRFLPFGVGRCSCLGIILVLPILALIVRKLVRSSKMVPPPGVDKLDVSEKGGQFNLHIANHSTVAFHPISP
ncbi:cytochrome P450 CYP73A100-like [Triticum urartu]|uniref:cytochrome P450 CYP73A100-like n=1 Tax=Triticum urartu TaxID=4572 RepID=UPI0020441C72|nr:cytochrome P450 CYP73A100-like [Triticum urartu]